MKKLLIVSCFAFTLISCARTKPDSTTCVGTAIPDCMCTMQYDPVCGCDGKTYGNACVAKCAGVKSWTKGECSK